MSNIISIGAVSEINVSRMFENPVASSSSRTGS
jgi:hypothetical protein